MDAENQLALGNAYVSMNLIGRSRCFRKTIQRIRKIAGYDVGVYIYGETGTGKELTARAIHYLSARRNGAFIPLSCGGLSDDLITNELFGHVKGAFTGANDTQPGMIQLADKGTLFLDEIDSLSPRAQIALLRFLQQKEFKSLGSTDIKSADTRILCASNQDLEGCVERQTFRRDLFYRLDVLRIDLPPLRQREEDVVLLARHFVGRYTQQFRLGQTDLDEDIIETLKSYSWPGNVRELENCMIKLCLLSEPPNLDSMEDIPSLIQRGAVDVGEHIDLGEGFTEAKSRMVSRFEKRYLQMLLTKAKGNVSQAARMAKKERRSLTRLLKKHGLHRDDFLPLNQQTCS